VAPTQGLSVDSDRNRGRGARTQFDASANAVQPAKRMRARAATARWFRLAAVQIVVLLVPGISARADQDANVASAPDASVPEDDNALHAPELLTSAPAEYPAAALASRVEAAVVLRLSIDAEGQVTGAEVAEPAGGGFDEATQAAARSFASSARAARRTGQRTARIDLDSGARVDAGGAAMSRNASVMLALAAILGTLPVALFANACIARFAPLSAEARFALAYTAVIPTWLVAMCFAWLVKSALRVWLICLVLTALLAGLTYGVPATTAAAAIGGKVVATK